MANRVKVKLIKSTNRRIEAHKACVRGLGLRGINSEVEVDADDPCIKGMINKVYYLLDVKKVGEA